MDKLHQWVRDNTPEGFVFQRITSSFQAIFYKPGTATETHSPVTVALDVPEFSDETETNIMLKALLDIAEETHPTLVMQLNDAKAYRNARLIAATAIEQIKAIRKMRG